MERNVLLPLNLRLPRLLEKSALLAPLRLELCLELCLPCPQLRVSCSSRSLCFLCLKLTQPLLLLLLLLLPRLIPTHRTRNAIGTRRGAGTCGGSRGREKQGQAE